MNTKSILVSVLALFIGTIVYAQNLKPYTIGAYAEGSIKDVASMVEQNLRSEGFEVIGSYRPVEDNNRWVISFTSDDLRSAVKKTGGLTGFALAWRVALTKENGTVIISYPTPEYWGNAYFRDSFAKVKNEYASYSTKILNAMKACGTKGGATFGSEEGHDKDKLQNYKYMFGMPKFDKTHTLNEFSSYDEAVRTIDANLQKGVSNLEKVYSVEIKDKQLKLYGIGLRGEKGEGKFMHKIDVSSPKHTAFLPYEFLVKGNEVHMLHGRFRIALSFPDLSMGQFMKIVSTPPDIKDLLETATL
ncbi:MAG: hypothetical protein HKO89_00525 [Saprospiraceae bacterium]|nr:hypothetical protein [Bacteroidia bacterium]NNK89067.1 hypothetical protein [Saprospiraceae bacterium]